MLFKVSAILASLAAAVSVATDHIDDPLQNELEPFSVPTELIATIISFFAPMEWSQLRFVSVIWNQALKESVHLYFRSHGTPVDPTKGYPFLVCSAQYTIEDALKSVMDQPGFRGAIFNKDECTLINHSLRGSQVCSEKGFDGRVKITGVTNIKSSGYSEMSECEDHFLHHIDSVLHAKNIHTGQHISIAEVDHHHSARLVNKNKVVIVETNQVRMYELDWNVDKAENHLHETKDGISYHNYQVLMDDSGEPSSILFRIDDAIYDFDIQSKQWTLIQKRSPSQRTQFSRDGKHLFITDDDKNEISIETTDGKTKLLRIPGNSCVHSWFHPSPDGKFVGFAFSSKYGMMNLRSHEITVIPDLRLYIPPLHWISDNLFRMTNKEGYKSIRCAHDPCVDLVHLGWEDWNDDQIQVDNELDAQSLFQDASRIGPSLFTAFNAHRAIQVEWMTNHPH